MGSKKSNSKPRATKTREQVQAEEDVVRERRAAEAAEAQAAAEGDEPSLEEQADQVVAAAALTRIQIDVAVNGLPSGQRLTVDHDHPFYSGLLEQKMAHVLTDEELEAEG